MTAITLSRVTDWATLGERWRELEARSNCSFFQSWTWMGCLADERFTDPVLLESKIDGRLMALALCNRRRGRTGREFLWLGESGVPALDTIFIEHNGILVAEDAPSGLMTDCFRALRHEPIGQRRLWRSRRLVLSGVDEDCLAAASLSGGGSWVRRARAAPYVDLDRVRQNGGDYLSGLSSNARYQLRRSDRAYAAECDVAVQCAASVAEALDFLGGLAELHQAAWNRRGRPGSFANHEFCRFHQVLIDRGFERGEIQLLRVTFGEQTIGLLYNYCFHGHVLAYQSGFDYETAGRHQKPGLTCHHQAIRLATINGAIRYDFLAGEDRYKRSLANAESRLYWLELGAGWPLRRCIDRVRELFTKMLPSG